MSSFLLRIKNAKQIVCVCSNKELYKCGDHQDKISILENASLVVDSLGKIAVIGSNETVDTWVNKQPQPVKFEKDIEADEYCILPGFVDGHTHPVWSGNRVGEFAMKLAGATYMEVHESGGGIHSTVRSTRASSEEELESLLRERLSRMVQHGTTLIEAKSGYGLDTETEIKMLKVLHQVNHPVEIVSNFLGAHSVPEGSTCRDATRDVIENQLPAILQAKQSGIISPEFIDVFCEKGVFEREETRKIVEAGKQTGLKINFHGDEINPMQSGELGAEVGAWAISHLETVDDKGIEAMAKHEPPIFAVLLPTTKYILKLRSPPARKLIENGVPVALGTDFNPNAHCLSMPLTMNMACVLMGMTMNESLTAATINAAASINKSSEYGSLEVGKFGDLVMVKAPRWEHVIYEMVDPPIQYVFKKGKSVYSSLKCINHK